MPFFFSFLGEWWHFFLFLSNFDNGVLSSRKLFIASLPNPSLKNDQELLMASHWFAEEMTQKWIPTVWDKWPQAWRVHFKPMIKITN